MNTTARIEVRVNQIISIYLYDAQKLMQAKLTGLRNGMKSCSQRVREKWKPTGGVACTLWWFDSIWSSHTSDDSDDIGLRTFAQDDILNPGKCNHSTPKVQRLIEWNVGVLADLLRADRYEPSRKRSWRKLAGANNPDTRLRRRQIHS
jgi:hypothetical protein